MAARTAQSKCPIAPTTDKATAIIAAAASLATTQVASAAVDASKTISLAAATALTLLKTAADVATTVVTDTAAKTLADFPNLHQDIREIRQAQREEAQTAADQFRLLTQSVADRFLLTDERIDGLSKWRWLVVGGAVTVGWLGSHFPAAIYTYLHN
jgi:hypothetical protein